MPTFPTQWDNHTPVTDVYDSASESYDGAELASGSVGGTYDGFLTTYDNDPTAWAVSQPTYGSNVATVGTPIGMLMGITRQTGGSTGGGTSWTPASPTPTNWSPG